MQLRINTPEIEIQEHNRDCCPDSRSCGQRHYKDPDNVQSLPSHAQLTAYFSALLENRLLEYDRVSQICKTIEKGNSFLRLYRQLDDIMQKRVE
jgi:hypothetical protein